MGGHARKHIVIYALYQPSFFYCRRRKQKKASSQREDERHSSLTQDHVTCMRFRPGHTNQGQITSCPSLVAPPLFLYTFHYSVTMHILFNMCSIKHNIIVRPPVRQLCITSTKDDNLPYPFFQLHICQLPVH